MKKILLIGEEDGELNIKMQDYAHKLGYHWESGDKYIEFEDVFENNCIDKRIVIKCDENGKMTYADYDYFFNYCAGKYDDYKVIDFKKYKSNKIMEIE